MAFVFDNFNRADGALGSNWITGGALNIAPIISGNAFTSGSGTSDNNSPSAFNNGGFALWNGSFQNNQIASVKITAVGAAGTDCAPGVVVRGDRSNMNGYYCFLGRNTTGPASGFQLELWKNVNGVATFLSGTPAPVIVVGDVIAISAIGTTISYYYNGFILNQFTDSNLTQGLIGICAELGSPGIDHPAATTKANSFCGYDFSDTPTQVVSDNFQRANGSLGSNWTDGAHAMAILSNEVHGGSANNCDDLWNSAVNAFPNDQYVSAVMASAPATGASPNAIDLAYRGVSNTLYFLRFGGGTNFQNIQFFKEVGGAFTKLCDSTANNGGVGSLIPVPNAGHTYAMNCRGPFLWATDNGTIIFIYNDSSITSGQPGLGGFTNDSLSAFWSNFSAGNFVTPSGGGSGLFTLGSVIFDYDSDGSILAECQLSTDA